jgi:hypothetical protein
MRVVAAAGELVDAVEAGVAEIEVAGTLSGLPPLTLAPGTTLRGGTLRFECAGLLLTRDNALDGMTVLCPDAEVAIGNETSAADLGTLSLRGVRTTGQVLLVAAGAVRAGHVRVDGLQVERADVRERTTPSPPRRRSG